MVEGVTTAQHAADHLAWLQRLLADGARVVESAARFVNDDLRVPVEVPEGHAQGRRRRVGPAVELLK